MRKKLLTLVTCIIFFLLIIAFGLKGMISYFSPKPIQEYDLARIQLSKLEIENYKVTKFDTKAIIRVDALNNGDTPVSDFPLAISYYSDKGKEIGGDRCNLLAGLNAQLIAQGRLTAEVSVSFPEGTSSIEVALDTK